MSRPKISAAEAAKRDYARPLEQPTVVKRSTPPTKPPIDHSPPAKFTYLLTAWTAERRSDGWYVRPANGDGKAPWSGPFREIETAVLAIGRGLACELADRHTRHLETYKIGPRDGRYGLKPTTRLKTKSNGSVA